MEGCSIGNVLNYRSLEGNTISQTLGQEPWEVNSGIYAYCRKFEGRVYARGNFGTI